MRDKTIRVLTKMPGSMWRVQHMDNTLEALQAFVGGYIETVRLLQDVVVICNEEGRLLGLPENCNLLGYNFVGPVILAGTEGDEFADVPENLIKNWKIVIADLPENLIENWKLVIEGEVEE